jgi:hypothetical protein
MVFLLVFFFLFALIRPTSLLHKNTNPAPPFLLASFFQFMALVFHSPSDFLNSDLPAAFDLPMHSFRHYRDSFCQ